MEDVKEKLERVIEAFCDKIHIGLPQCKTTKELLLERMLNVGWIDRREHDEFYAYLNREEDE